MGTERLEWRGEKGSFAMWSPESWASEAPSVFEGKVAVSNEAWEKSESSVPTRWERRFTLERREGDRGEGAGSLDDDGGSVNSGGVELKARERARAR